LCSPCRTSVSGAMPVCDSGMCDFKCNSDRTQCSGACVDTRSDKNNCGRCGNACSGAQSCDRGACECPAGTHDCNGRCVSNTDVATCGDRCSPCPAPTAGSGQATCTFGQCDFTCNPSTPQKCGNQCVNIYTDPKHCGGCDAAPCANQHICENGKCTCGAGKLDCVYECQDAFDVKSCGTCWVACNDDPNGIGTPQCTAQQTCVLSCPSTHVFDENAYTCVPRA
jgi:hypothetical protein